MAAVVAALGAAGYQSDVLGPAGHAIAYLEYRRDGRTGWSCARADSVSAAGIAAVVRAAVVAPPE